MLQHQIQDRAAFEEALAAGPFLVLKHSQRCSTSAFAFREYRRFIETHPEVPHGWLDVVAQREWAQEVAAVTGIKHRSPQVLWIVEGVVRWHTSHFEITRESLAENVLQRPFSASGRRPRAPRRSGSRRRRRA